MNLNFINLMYFLFGVCLTLIILGVLFAKFKNILSRDFVKIANDTIKNEQEDLRKQNREALEEKLIPFIRELGEFRNNIERLNLSGVENTTRIIEQLGILERNNKSIEQEAKNLTEALTKNQNIKGAYGEDILDKVLQNSGLTEGVHYTKQYSTFSECSDGNRQIRPDVVLNLPDNRHLIIDSKVTLKTYLDFVKDNSKLKDFKTEVKKRIAELSEKNYQNAYGINQPDFVLMYMPIDSSVGLLYEDDDIINYAYKSNIIIVGTASLLVAIRLVNQLFAQQKQCENVQRIVSAGTNLYETFVLLCNELVSIQNDFEQLSKQFTTVINRFQRQNKNKPSLFSQINELKNYGINSNKEMPYKLQQTDVCEVEEEV